MNKVFRNEWHFELPKGFIVFISGVPGVGKTTISYELFRLFDQFRIVEETDIIREVLRGYSEYIKERFKDQELPKLDELEIAHNTKILSYDEAKMQCVHMKKSVEKVVHRQKRKGIATIINGVHIIPEVLNGLSKNENIIFFNLHVSNECALFQRWAKRDLTKYTPDNLSIAFQTNLALSKSTRLLSEISGDIFHDVDVTNRDIDQTKVEIVRLLSNRLRNSQA